MLDAHRGLPEWDRLRGLMASEASVRALRLQTSVSGGRALGVSGGSGRAPQSSEKAPSHWE